MGIEIHRYDLALQEEWNNFVRCSNEGTIFHRLDFLRYHREKFAQHEHQLAWYKGQTLVGVMPMAIFEEEGRIVAKSPYGASYGGPIFKKPLNYADSHRVVGSLLTYLTELGIEACRLTLPIACCYKRYSETFRLALLEHGFRRTNSDISSVVCLNGGNPISEEMTSRARNMARKARKGGVMAVHQSSVADFWLVMKKTHEKLGTKPTHSVEEFQWLCNELPELIYVDVAYLEGIPVAGIGFLVINKRVNSSFYFAQDPQKQHLQGLSLLIYEALERAQQEGFRWFDFGTSSANQKGRENLFRFKESFGAVGLFRDTYVWEAT